MVNGEETEVVLIEEEREEDVTWDRYLPHMPVRVLLVEGDDSTRQIIAALLRKCSYRVAAVADGMKAWDTLKEKSNNIDLVLTEVELPFMSGFGLLTMIMEHNICKNIPVIMMSSHDSMSMVFKCMLKGAADFLVKPIRKNELRNLWQHVWRRQLASERTGAIQGSRDVSLENLDMGDKMDIEKISGGNENAENLEKSNELSEQRSDAQSSCTRSDAEAESKHLQNRNLDLSINMSALTTVSGPSGAKISPHTVDRPKHVSLEIGTHHNEEHLELSLRRTEYQAPLNEQKESEERNNKLNHSNSSPFSLYNCRLGVTQVATAELTECVTPVSNLDLNLTCDDTKPSATPVQDKATLQSTLIKSVPVPVPTGGFPLDQLFSSFIPMPAPENNQVTEIEEEEEMTTAPGFGDPLVEENNKDTSKRVSDCRSSSVAVSIVGSAMPSIGNACVSNNEGLRSLTQREIALNKFRLKRKERCFEKKVRYQSRKLLAEKRLRVKGQFVRQDQLVQEAGRSHGMR